jgi:hypothetical protein
MKINDSIILQVLLYDISHSGLWPAHSISNIGYFNPTRRFSFSEIDNQCDSVQIKAFFSSRVFFMMVLRTCLRLFHTRVATQKMRRQGAKRGLGLWPSFATRPPRFLCATRRDGTDFIRPFVTRRLRRPAPPRGSCLVLDEIRRRRGCEISVNRPWLFHHRGELGERK